MKSKRIASVFLASTLLACNYVTQMVFPPTATPTATATVTASPTGTATLTPLVPAYIPSECATVPLATIPPELAMQATPDVQITEISQDEQRTILSEITNLVQSIYVYPDYNGKDWNDIKARYLTKVEAGLDTQSFYNEMSAMITELGDEHSFFLSPMEVAEAEAELRGEIEFVGVGIYGQPDFERGRMIVISTFPGSPAEYGGLQHHDSILLVDGQTIDENFSNLLRGPQCSAVVLTVQSPG